MEELTVTYPILYGFFAFFQAVLAVWSYFKTRNYIYAAGTLIVPFLGLPVTLWRMRPDVKDNQVGGVVTYLGVILGIAYLIFWTRAHPDDLDVPWMAIFTMQFFAGLAVANIINLSVDVRRGNNAPGA